MPSAKMGVARAWRDNTPQSTIRAEREMSVRMHAWSLVIPTSFPCGRPTPLPCGRPTSLPCGRPRHQLSIRLKQTSRGTHLLPQRRRCRTRSGGEDAGVGGGRGGSAGGNIGDGAIRKARRGHRGELGVHLALGRLVVPITSIINSHPITNTREQNTFIETKAAGGRVPGLRMHTLELTRRFHHESRECRRCWG